MNYLKSVIKETMRLHPPIPLLVPIEYTKSSKIYGYDIPAKTRVMLNAWAIGRDPRSWEDSNKFQPERFMDGGNKSHVDFRGHDFELIPFGAGKRIFPEIHFATSTIQCTLANLLHIFHWKMHDGMDIDMDEGHGVSLQKKTHLILVPTPWFP
ncbi:Cytochrome P450 [Cinnamomum micranthum f. kanehirae]|uniref:Cytochrome P450 n=1 Tax=Cinnamomum micranthum f. kanehirae TaxID=337451 RepID=A0A443N461_9MAGN|nr:Cytochrome P450 [Cinnamomum micranthum f. kanehirae]